MCTYWHFICFLFGERSSCLGAHRLRGARARLARGRSLGAGRQDPRQAGGCGGQAGGGEAEEAGGAPAARE